MNFFSSTYSFFKRCIFSSFFFRFGLCALFLMMIITAIAIQGLFELDLLNPNLVNPQAPNQILMPSPLPAPQIIITPSIPQPPDHFSSLPLPNHNFNFPLLIFVGILISSALVSFLVTAFLKYLSLPLNQKKVINDRFTFIFKIIFLVVKLVQQKIIKISHKFLNFLISLEQNNQVKTNKNKKKSKSKYAPKNVNSWPENNQNRGYRLTNTNDNFNPTFKQPIKGLVLSYNDQLENVNPSSPNYSHNQQNQTKKKTKPNQNKVKKQPENYQFWDKSSKPKQKKRKTNQPPIQTQNAYYSNQNYHYNQTQVTILPPEEQTPLDQKQPTLAELMDVRRRQSLSSLLENS